MKLTGDAGSLPQHEQQVILGMAAAIGVPATFLAAIRIAENGAAGREFGVLSERAGTYETQARVAAVSIQNNVFRFIQATGKWPTDPAGALSDDFIRFMASRWAPPGAANDPTDLNKNWPGNVSRIYRASGVSLT